MKGDVSFECNFRNPSWEKKVLFENFLDQKSTPIFRWERQIKLKRVLQIHWNAQCRYYFVLTLVFKNIWTSLEIKKTMMHFLSNQFSVLFMQEFGFVPFMVFSLITLSSSVSNFYVHNQVVSSHIRVCHCAKSLRMHG